MRLAGDCLVVSKKDGILTTFLISKKFLEAAGLRKTVKYFPFSMFIPFFRSLSPCLLSISVKTVASFLGGKTKEEHDMEVDTLKRFSSYNVEVV